MLPCGGCQRIAYSYARDMSGMQYAVLNHMQHICGG